MANSKVQRLIIIKFIFHNTNLVVITHTSLIQLLKFILVHGKNFEFKLRFKIQLNETVINLNDLFFFNFWKIKI